MTEEPGIVIQWVSLEELIKMYPLSEEETEIARREYEIWGLTYEERDRMKQFIRLTPDNITELPPDTIFVFGSNLSGRHGKGAAKLALSWGAKWGQASGLQGKTYGIPTKNASITRTLSVNEIRPFVDEFIEFAKEHPELTFYVTEIGCGLAGYKPKDIAPLFEKAGEVSNIFLPARFWHKLQPY
jgi:hypothetical protein